MRNHYKFVLRNRVKDLRLEHGVTQEQLAAAVGVSRNTISSIETGQFNPTAFHAGLICNFFGKYFEEVFWIEER